MTRKSSKLSPQQRNRKRRKKRRTQKKSLNAHLSEVSRREWEKQFGPPERELSLRDASCPPPVPKTVEQRSADTGGSGAGSPPEPLAAQGSPLAAAVRPA